MCGGRAGREAGAEQLCAHSQDEQSTSDLLQNKEEEAGETIQIAFTGKDQDPEGNRRKTRMQTSKNTVTLKV